MGNCSGSKAKISSERENKSQISKKEGDNVPHTIFKIRVRAKDGEATDCFAWKDVSSTELLKGKRVVIFSIPGGTSRQIDCIILFSLSLLLLLMRLVQLLRLFVLVTTSLAMRRIMVREGKNESHSLTM
jgi:hypothetical protein